MKPCPYCAEEIQDAAILCKHCGQRLDQPVRQAAKPPAPVTAGTIAGGSCLGILGALVTLILLPILVLVGVLLIATTDGFASRLSIEGWRWLTIGVGVLSLALIAFGYGKHKLSGAGAVLLTAIATLLLVATLWMVATLPPSPRVTRDVSAVKLVNVVERRAGKRVILVGSVQNKGKSAVERVAVRCALLSDTGTRDSESVAVGYLPPNGYGQFSMELEHRFGDDVRVECEPRVARD